MKSRTVKRSWWIFWTVMGPLTVLLLLAVFLIGGWSAILLMLGVFIGWAVLAKIYVHRVQRGQRI